MMAKIKELKHGDTVRLEDGGTATIVSCKPFPLVESAKPGGTYEIEYRDGKETGKVLTAGNNEIELV
jgi:hypothetical protein